MLGDLMTRALLLAIAALALYAGCAAPAAAPAAETAPRSEAEALPRGQARVEGVREFGPYLEAHLAGRAGRQGFLFVASESCRNALAEGAIVRIAAAKPLIRVTSASGVHCAARGLSSLAAWRDALPERRASYLVLTKPAELRLVLETPGFLLASGKLPLALELRWSTPLNVAAVLPDTPACRKHLARGRTKMEFRPRGEPALLLRGRLEECPVLAIAEPVFLD
jgi:hypothetical protein